MKNKKTLGLLGLVLCIIFAVANVALASTYIEGVTYYNPAQYQSSRYTQYRYNCKLFANEVVKATTYAYGLPGWNNPDPNNHEMRYYPGYDNNLVAIYLNSQNSNRGPSASHLKNTIFANARPCDVVQMYWNSTEHTALISGFGNDDRGNAGVWFFESNVSREINNHFYTYETLASRYGNAGSRGGVSIYRFGSAPAVSSPTITDTPNVAIRAGEYFSYQCRADGSPTSWSASNLPDGLSINPSTGLISGTVSHTTRGKASYYSIGYSVTVTASNSAGTSRKSAYISVFEPPVITTDSNLPDGQLNTYYSQELYAEGTESGMTWKIKSGSLPNGVRFNHQKDSRVPRIEGTPSQRGTYTFTLELGNSANASTTKTFTLKIGGEYPEPNMWWTGSTWTYMGMSTNPNFSDGKVGEHYSSKVLLDFSSLMYVSRWTASTTGARVISGNFPDNMFLTKSGYGVWMHGTPKQSGTYTFTLRAVNNMGGYADKRFTIYIAPKDNTPKPDSDMSILYVFLKPKVGLTFNDYVIVRGGTSPYTASVIDGELPSGLRVVTMGSYIYLRGIPKDYGIYYFTLRVTGAHNGYVDKSFALTVNPNSSYSRAGAAGDEDQGRPKIITSKLPYGAEGSDFSVQLEAAGARPITWSSDIELPEGFFLTEDGRLTGFPAESGKYRFKITAQNSEGSARRNYTLTVKPVKPSINTSELPDAVLNAPYSFMIDAGGSAPIKYSRTGKIAPGLKIDKDTGEIYGTPTKSGTYEFKLRAKNKGGTDTVPVKLTVIDPEDTDTIIISSASAPLNGQSYSFTNTELYLVTEGEESDDDVIVKAGVPLTFKADDWSDGYEAEVLINDEPAGGIEIAEDGSFTIPGELVSGKFTVCVRAHDGDHEIETSDIEVTAYGDSGNSSGGCELSFAGMALMILCGTFIFRRH